MKRDRPNRVAVPLKSSHTRHWRVVKRIYSTQNTTPESQTVPSELTRRTKQLLSKHRAQPPFGTQQQPVHTAEHNRHRAQRIPFETKPKKTWENALQLLQPRLKPEQERGLYDQGFDAMRF